MANVPDENSITKVTVFKDIPYGVLDEDLSGTLKDDFFAELGQIKKLYKAYEDGAKFDTEGSNADYIPSQLRFKKARHLINEEARFMFSQPIDVCINKDSASTELQKAQNSVINEYVANVLDKNHFNSNVVKAAKDCFIGKRVCIVLNFDPNSGVAINFLNALEFYYELQDDQLVKLVAFFIDVDSGNASERRVRKKTFDMENGYCYVTEKMYDGGGIELEEMLPRTKTLLNEIPAWIIFNDGLVNDTRGESDLMNLIESEALYSKIANGDVDAERKTMNPIKYAIDASYESTKNLSTSPGSFWDIQSDENGVEQKSAKVGQLESSMAYSTALTTTLDRIESQMYSDVSVPNITVDKLQGVVSSGKTLKAIYWSLIVRSDEKMLVWFSALRSMVEMIYKGSLLYSDVTQYYIVDELPNIEIKIDIDSNYALPEDVEEEKQIDLAEVQAQTMSRKAYMIKWRGLTDEEADEELQQIALEKELLESSAGFMPQTDGSDDINNFNMEEDNNESDSDNEVE